MVTTMSRAGWRVWALAVALMSGPALAAGYYVNDDRLEGDVALPGCPVMPKGEDVHRCGDCDTPCRTPAFLVGGSGVALKMGDTIHLNTGRYHALADREPIVTFAGPWASGSGETWLTLTGPVDGDGLPLRDASGLPLAVLDGKGSAEAGVVVKVDGVRVRALRLESFADAPAPLCGSAVHVLPDEPVHRYAFEHLDIAGVTSGIGSAIEVEQGSTLCISCTIAHNRIHASPAGQPAIVVDRQTGVKIIGNHITGWGRDERAAGVMSVGAQLQLRHNVIQGSAGPGALVSRRSEILHNTFRDNGKEAGASGSRAELALGLTAVSSRIEHNIFAPGPGGVALSLPTLSGASDFDFNGYALERGALAFTSSDGRIYTSLATWREASGVDARSLEGTARFASEVDAHLRSVSGRWDGGEWVPDDETSDFIDVGNPLLDPLLETHFLQGGVVNLGAYGNTPEASLSPARLAKLGGDGQEGAIGAPLGDVLRVEVRGFNRLDIIHPSYPDVPVRFRVISGSATLTEERVLSDAMGRVAVGVTPDAAGSLVIEASVEGVRGVQPITFEALVTAGDSGENPDPDPGEGPVPGRGQYTVTSGCTQAWGPAASPLLWMLSLALLGRRVRRRAPADLAALGRTQRP